MSAHPHSGHELHPWWKGYFNRMLGYDWLYDLFRKISLLDKLTAKIKHTYES